MPLKREQGHLQALHRGGLDQGHLELADEIFDRYIRHQPDGSVLERGPEEVKRFVSEFHAGFPDLHYRKEQIADGDKVMSRTVRGTHQGEFRGMHPPARSCRSRA